MIFDQSEFDIRCEWGQHGVQHLAPISDAVIIVDVLSFSTAVVVAVGCGATVYPYGERDGSEVRYAKSLEAVLAGPRGKAEYSLSPTSLTNIPSGTRLVLPSLNGATLTRAQRGRFPLSPDVCAMPKQWQRPPCTAESA